MKRNLFFIHLIFFIVLLPLTIQTGHAEDSLRAEFVLDPSRAQTIVIEGSSTLHDWSCETEEVEGRFLFYVSPGQLFSAVERIEQTVASGDSPREVPQLPQRIPYIRVKIPIRSFECGRRAMNEDMYEALKADLEPNIEFMFYRIAHYDTDVSKQNEIRLRVTGGLSMAEVGKTVELPVNIRRTGPTTFRVRGSVPMTMSQFNVKPPSAFFGLIKAYDDIKIKFDLRVKIHEPGS